MQTQETGVPSLFVIPLMQCFVGALLLIALLNGQRDLIVLTVLVLAVMIGARLWTHRSLAGLQHHLRIDKLKAFPGENLTLKVTVENAKLLPIWLRMNIPAKGLTPPSSGETALTKEGSLLWYQRMHFDWDLTTDRRGVYQVGPLYLQAGDLFAFSSRQKRLRSPAPSLFTQDSSRSDPSLCHGLISSAFPRQNTPFRIRSTS